MPKCPEVCLATARKSGPEVKNFGKSWKNCDRKDRVDRWAGLGCQSAGTPATEGNIESRKKVTRRGSAGNMGGRVSTLPRTQSGSEKESCGWHGPGRGKNVCNNHCHLGSYTKETWAVCQWQLPPPTRAAAPPSPINPGGHKKILTPQN